MAYTEFFAKPTGSNINAGSTQSDTAAYTATNGGWNSGTGVFTPTSGNPSLTVAVGDFASVYSDGATLAVFIARVTAVNSTTITVSTTIKSGTAPTTAGTGISIKVGGAWKGADTAVIFPFNFLTSALRDIADNMPRVNILAGTYAMTATITANQAGITFQGYTTTPGDGGIVIYDFTGSTTSGINNTGAACGFLYIWVQHVNQATEAITLGTRSFAFRCMAQDVTSAGFRLGAAAFAVECEVHDWNTVNGSGRIAFQANGAGASFLRCYAHDSNPGNESIGFGFFNPGDSVYVNCIASNCTTGFRLSGAGNSCKAVGCDVYNSTGDGFAIGGATGAQYYYLENCNSFKNGGYAFNSILSASGVIFLINCASGSGSMRSVSGRLNGLNLNDIAPIIYPSGDHPWCNPRMADFSIVHALAKSTGRGLFLQSQLARALTVAYPDIGAAAYRALPPVTNWDSPDQELV